MAKYIHSILQSDTDVSGDGVTVYDLPVNPLSVILLKIAPLNVTSTIANHTLVADILNCVTNIRVTHQGASLFDASGQDAAVVAAFANNYLVWQSNPDEVDNDRRALILPLCFGRVPFDPNEAIPESRRGENQLSITVDDAHNGVDNLNIGIETIELPDASPGRVQKVTTLSQTFAATGQNEQDLPIGNMLRGVLLWGTSAYEGASPAPTIGQVSLLRNNMQEYVSSSNWETLRGLHGLENRIQPLFFDHGHGVNAAGGGQENTQEPGSIDGLDANYAYVNLDPTRDDTYTLDSSGASSLRLRFEAEAAEAVRVLPIESVPAERFS